jgi:2-polyprenyl-3-methyl-5-hydroxy-6-metoxy-1,4-benzoquinol methylase
VIKKRNAKDDNLLQLEGHKNIYRLSDEEIASFPKLLDEHTNLLIELCKLSDFRSAESSNFLDFGCGRGIMVFAASRLGYKKAIGIDLDREIFDQSHQLYKQIGFSGNSCSFYDKIEEVEERIDFLLMWHVIEHIYEPFDILSKLTMKLNRNATILVQYPQYKEEYFCDAHYYFYNEPSIKMLFKRVNISVERFIYDYENEFGTVLGKYQGN